MPKRKRIGLFGNFGGSNFGNEGTLEAMLNFLRRVLGDAEFVCICSEPDNASARYGVTALPIRVPRLADASYLEKIAYRFADLAHVVRNVRDFEVLIIPGTGILDDFGESPQGMPFSIFSICAVARLRGIKTWFVSIGAGPIRNRASRWLMTRAAAMAEYRSYRDLVSKDYMQSIGFHSSQDPVYPDIAFSLPRPQSPQRRPSPGRALTVAVGVMSYFGWYADPKLGPSIYAAYLEKLERFVVWLLDNGHRVRLLIGETTDKRTIADILAALNRQRPALVEQQIIAEPSGSLHDVLRQIADADVVVATRYHNIVCSLMLSKPTISIGYAKKNDDLMQEVGLAAYCQQIEELDVDHLMTQFEHLTSDLVSNEQSVRAANAVLSNRIAQQETLLADRLLA